MIRLKWDPEDVTQLAASGLKGLRSEIMAAVTNLSYAKHYNNSVAVVFWEGYIRLLEEARILARKGGK